MRTNSKGFVPFLALLILLIVVVGGYLIYKKFIPEFSNIVQPPESDRFTNPNTGDLYQDIKVRMKEVLP